MLRQRRVRNPNAIRGEQIRRDILKCIATSALPPTIRELGEAVNRSSSSTIHNHLTTLQQLGLITRQASIPRGLAITEQGWQSLCQRPRALDVDAVRRILEVAGRQDLDPEAVLREVLS